MSESDLIALYSARILELTTQIPHLGRLDGAAGHGAVGQGAVGQGAVGQGAVGQGSARSPHCGSTVSVEVALTGGQITGFAQQVKACALGQASAAIFGAGVLGQRADDMPRLREQLAAMLAMGAPPPPAPFEGYEVLRAAQSYKNRHASILLCVDATITACRAAQS